MRTRSGAPGDMEGRSAFARCATAHNLRTRAERRLARKRGLEPLRSYERQTLKLVRFHYHHFRVTNKVRSIRARQWFRGQKGAGPTATLAFLVMWLL
jgi:hypothetical protein